MTKPMWMIRAAGGGSLLDDFKEKQIVAIGWALLGSLTNYAGRKAIEAKTKEVWPDWST